MQADAQAHDTTSAKNNVDDAELAKFRTLAEQWWLPNGKFQALHALGPARMTFIRDALREVPRQEASIGGTNNLSSTTPLRGLRVLDVGCGGGLICEPLSRLGASVCGIDPAAENIEAAKMHAKAQGLEIDYRATTAEELASAGETFDAVTCLEVVEHVPHVDAFVSTCASLIRPSGKFVCSTINRTVKSYALAIVAAEYVLGWVPRGTHQWERFVTPDELTRAFEKAGLTAPHFSGMIYDPLRDSWRLGADTDVNYLASASRQSP